MTGLKICRNTTSTGKDKSAEKALIKNNGIFTPIPTTFHIPAPALTPNPPDIYTNIDLQKATRMVLNSFVER